MISLHVSFLLLMAYFCYQGWSETGMPGLWWSWTDFLLIFTSVLLHELGHSFMAMRFGVGVHRILLMPIGGMAQFDSIPRSPVQELLITAAGPAVNFAIVAALWAFVDFPPGWDSGTGPITLVGIGRYLIQGNLMLGFFNIYPAFPMDGGRILRALLATRMPYLRATRWAVVIGRAFAVIGIAWALYVQWYLLVAVFLFILSVGTAEYQGLKQQELEEERWKEALRRHLADVASAAPPLLEK
jgi:Zn-dependent protease